MSTKFKGIVSLCCLFLKQWSKVYIINFCGYSSLYDSSHSKTKISWSSFLNPCSPQKWCGEGVTYIFLRWIVIFLGKAFDPFLTPALLVNIICCVDHSHYLLLHKIRCSSCSPDLQIPVFPSEKLILIL